MKPVTHPRHRANLLQQARRLRFEGARVRRSDGEAVGDHQAAAQQSAQLWREEREAYEAWNAYAAEILEAGAGGVEPLDGDDGGGRGESEPEGSTSRDQTRRVAPAPALQQR